jgi:hypothetical protein
MRLLRNERVRLGRRGRSIGYLEEGRRGIEWKKEVEDVS